MPADFLSTYHEAQKQVESGNLREAADLCKQLLDVDQRSPHGHYLMAQIFLKSGDLNRALAFAERTVKYASDVAEFHALLGHILLQLGKSWAAEQSCRAALALNMDYHP